MSAPKTNLEAQRRHHIGPIAGIVGVVIVVLALLTWWIGVEFEHGQSPRDNGAQINDQTGTVEKAKPPEKPAPQPDITNGNGTQPAAKQAPESVTGPGASK